MHTFYFPMMHLASAESSIIVPSDHVIVPTLLNVLFIHVRYVCTMRSEVCNISSSTDSTHRRSCECAAGPVSFHCLQ